MKFSHLFLLVFAFICWQPALAAEKSPEYYADIEPVLRKYCVGCHNDADREADISLQTMAGIRGEGSEGPLVVDRQPGQSPLLAVIRGEAEPKMPPEGEPSPSKEEVARIAAWIEAGLPVSKRAQPDWKLDVPPIESQTELRPITALAVNSDSNRIAMGRYGHVEIFKLQEDGGYHPGEPQQTLENLPGKVTSVHFYEEGKHLLVASGVTGLAGYAALFDVDSGQLIREFQGHTDILYDAEFSPDGRWLATCGYDRTIVLWNAHTGQKRHQLTGHNGAVYDIGFSPDSRFLVSGSADDTCKVWRVEDAVRLDTLPQPLKEVYCCTFSPDGKTIVAGGADNNLRVWKFVSQEGSKINPMVVARFAHEGPVQRIAFNEDGTRLFSVGNDLTVKLWDTSDYTEIKAWNDRPEVAMAADYLPSSRSLYLGRMDGSVDRVSIAKLESKLNDAEPMPQPRSATLADRTTQTITEKEVNDTPETAQAIAIPAMVSGHIHNEAAATDEDFYRFSANAGETWVLEINAARSKSPLDSHISIYHADGSPVERMKLQAVRDSYFTFRGKNDSISDDFRIFNWKEMKLNQYLYSSGEVARLWRHPRGPDSGFQVYPGQGDRWGYFDTTPLAHALGEPCYIVEPIVPGETVIPNGLPIFTLYYENDDESRRTQGRDSKLFFTAPVDGEYLAKVRDVRGFQGSDYKYELTVRPRKEDFRVSLVTPDLKVAAGSHQEIRFRANRMDHFDGPIQIEIKGVPEGFNVTSPIIVEYGQIEAMGVIEAAANSKTLSEDDLKQVKITAKATIHDLETVHNVDGFKKLEVRENTKLKVRIAAAENGPLPLSPDGEGPLEFEMRSGETIMLMVVAERNGEDGHIAFGTAGAGRNLPFGVNIADLGLNGLMVMADQTEREFFIKADEVAAPTSRWFHLQTNSDGGHATQAVLLRVRP